MLRNKSTKQIGVKKKLHEKETYFPITVAIKKKDNCNHDNSF